MSARTLSHSWVVSIFYFEFIKDYYELLDYNDSDNKLFPNTLSFRWTGHLTWYQAGDRVRLPATPIFDKKWAFRGVEYNDLSKISFPLHLEIFWEQIT